MRPFAGTSLVLGTLGLGFWVAGPHLTAQSPAPRALPASLTGAVPAAAVVPTASSQIQAPIQRFQDFRNLSPEAVQSLYGMRAAAEWLWRMNLPNGRFRAGLEPSLKQVVPDERDFTQAVACWGLARAARFTADEKLSARVSQTALTLLTQTKLDAETGCRVPSSAVEGDSRLGFAAALSLSLREVGDGEPRWAVAADELCRYVVRCQQTDGAFRDGDGANAKPVDAKSATAGVVLQALAAALVRKPDPATQEAVQRGLSHYRSHAAASPALAGAMLPAVAVVHQATKNPGVAALGTELLDGLVAKQLTRATEFRTAWIGGFPADGAGPPSIETAWCVQGLAAAGSLARTLPDATRFQQARASASAAVLFARGLQFTDENADHFEKQFRGRYVLGGVHPTPADGAIRADGTALLILATASYLEAFGDAKLE